MPPQKQNELQEVFDFFDHDSDGKLVDKEIIQALRAIGCMPTVEEQRKVKGVAMDMAAFQQAANSMGKTVMSTAQLKDAFDSFDLNGDGRVEMSKFYQALMTLADPMTEDEIETMTDGIEVDEEGTIGVEEFMRMLTGL